MLISEIKGWQWLITWDNPKPADSSAMLAALSKLGRVTKAQTKTTVLFAPRSTVDWIVIRRALVANLHPAKGSVVYANLRTQKVFEYGWQTNFYWRSV